MFNIFEFSPTGLELLVNAYNISHGVFYWLEDIRGQIHVTGIDILLNRNQCWHSKLTELFHCENLMAVSNLWQQADMSLIYLLTLDRYFQGKSILQHLLFEKGSWICQNNCKWNESWHSHFTYGILNSMLIKFGVWLLIYILF